MPRSDVNDNNSSEREFPCRTLFVRNIAYEVSTDELREMFEQYGEIKRFFPLINKRGMAFITYYDIRHAERAKKTENAAQLHGREIDIHFSLPREKPRKDKDPNDDDDSNHGTLFVAIVDATGYGNDDIKSTFSQYGELRGVRDQGRSDSGNKFVEFFDLRAAQKAKEELNNGSFCGGHFEIRYAFQSKRVQEAQKRERNRRNHPEPSDYHNAPPQRHNIGPIRSGGGGRRVGYRHGDPIPTRGGAMNIHDPYIPTHAHGPSSQPPPVQANPLAVQQQVLSQMQRLASLLGTQNTNVVQQPSIQPIHPPIHASPMKPAIQPQMPVQQAPQANPIQHLASLLLAQQTRLQNQNAPPQMGQYGQQVPPQVPQHREPVPPRREPVDYTPPYNNYDNNNNSNKVKGMEGISVQIIT
eukprot:CAMPEP_0168532024 /NCGR_PEP_ID=MMETSP0405-20121227/15911_1 /TAXON_ID=498012 /ORGANISM="Trichosphaerium sp, Strain Am-I-7 wt" /LENGTH=411 /DNA_ID=CAMNT_0008557167 /DNA_START=251 /DNA_END=1487 /DNA_ORIENTATION=-